MISEGPNVIEALPGALEAALKGALLPEEELLIAVRGGVREAFAATPDRLLVLKEPRITGTGPVEVLECSLNSVSGVRAEPRPVGGRLMWESTEQAAPTSIEYPTYDASKYALVAKRLQEMIGQSKTPRPPAVAPAEDPSGAGRACPSCRTLIPQGGAWCPKCGLQASDPCWGCGRALPDGANFCPRCGTAATEPAVVSCPGCQASVPWGHGYCTACGAQVRAVCEACEQAMRQDWSHCPRCGGSPAWDESDEEEADQAEISLRPVTPAAAPRPAGRNADSINARAVEAYEKGDFAEAGRLFRQAVEIDPENAGYWVNLGVALGEAGDDLQAFSAYRRATELNPDEVQAYLNMGYLYMERERNAEAREMWETVIRLAPDSDEAQEAREYLKRVEDV